MAWLEDRYEQLKDWAVEEAAGIDMEEYDRIQAMPPGPTRRQAQADWINKYGDAISNIKDYDVGDAAAYLWGEVKEIPGEIGDLSLNFVRGLGAALVDGVDGAYDAVRGKLRGREPDVIAGITVAAITILTVVFLYNGAKNAKDVF